MKIQLTYEEIKKAIAFYTREKLIPHSEYRNINEVEINEKGASLVVTTVPAGPLQTGFPAAPVPHGEGY